MGLKLHHKISAPVIATVVADHAAEKLQEHVFLAVHEYIAHHGYLYLTVACAGGILIGVPLVVRWFKRKEREVFDHDKED